MQTLHQMSEISKEVLRDEQNISGDASKVDLRIGNGTMRIMKKDIHKQYDRRDMSVDRADENKSDCL